MFKVCLVLFLFASVHSESGLWSYPGLPLVPQQVREMETWMPTTRPDDLVSSGDSPNGSDFAFTEDTHTTVDAEDDTPYDDEDDEEESEFSGSGDGATTVPTRWDQDKTPAMPDVNDNQISELERPALPTVDEVEAVRKSNEIHLHSNEAPSSHEEQPSNVLMSHASDESIFNKTEVLAALIAGGAVGLIFAVLLILLLIYRMKKKDEGSYDLGKKPIYKKAPTTEIYA
ncbi:syndecan-4 isoform X2 [Gadus macrocephalus]|uniref:syndecan-4 isoform X2 n=1 Tax=Gadus macrocephalus TaxID=80720 RepID=UPI0028CB9D5C|nr:syndecan-4 isoform X2 [Gadus macrocephalus]